MILMISLLAVGVYFTIQFRGVQIRYIGHMCRLLIGSNQKDEAHHGVSSFQAFCISLASRVGTGNLAGVAIAISIGGPGAIFWMWVVALLGGASAFVESTLAQAYKVKGKFGYRGGPAYYMEKGLHAKWMGVLFSVLITVTFAFVFNSVQANTITLAFGQAFDMDKRVIGALVTLFSALVFFGGIKRIASISEKIVPFMAVLYLLVVVYVLIINAREIPSLFALIFTEAFNVESAFGGSFMGVLIIGVKRGLFSNEAGMGSAPNAAATAEVTHPVKQGFIQSLGVFTDTLVICSATAFIILLSGTYTSGESNGIELTQLALNTLVGSWASTFIAISILLFAFSSIIGNYYYGETNLKFLGVSPLGLLLFRFFVVAMILIGSLVELEMVWAAADFFMTIMALINLIAILLLSKVAFTLYQDYVKQLGQGIDPVYQKKENKLKYMAGITCWPTKKSSP